MTARQSLRARPLAIIKMGSPVPPVLAKHGEFAEWFAAGLRFADDEIRVIDAPAGVPLPRADDVSGVLITGAAAMVTERLPWSERTAAWLPSVLAAGTPLLGVCYGHQLLAQALDGEVGVNPRGPEMGTVTISMATEAADDPLLSVLPARPVVHVSHFESVLRLPTGARLLASGEGDPHHAYTIGDQAWGVQFHPEFDAAIMRGYLAERSERLAGYGLDAPALIDAVQESEHGRALLARFGELVRAAAR